LAFRAIESRFMRTQSPTDHGWAYNGLGGGGSSTPSMTCAGLLGLAVAAAHDAGKLPGDRAEGAPAQPNQPPKKPVEDDPRFDLLFLATSSFVSGLPARIKGKGKGPGAAEMTGTKGAPLAAGGSAEAGRVPGAGGSANATPQGPGDLARLQERTAAEKVADG